MAKGANRTIGIYPELKTPPFFTENVPDFDYPAVLGTLSKMVLFPRDILRLSAIHP